MNAHDKWLQAPYAAAAIDHEALQAEIAAEAEARLIEWQRIEGASRDAHNFELLQNDIEFIVMYAARVLSEPKAIQREELEGLGRYVAAKVKRAAMDVATHVCTDKVMA